MTVLVDRATEFAEVLTKVVNGTITTGAQFVVTPVAGEPQVWIFPADSTPTRSRLLPLTTGRGPGEPARLWIKATFRASLDDTGRHLAIRTSVFALVIDEATARPAVRLEYDREFGSEPDDSRLGVHRRSAAHVQIHGASEELAYAQAVSGLRLRRLEKFHIPVGGRRFRPTLEDFIEFLHAEKLIRLHDGWPEVIAEHRRDWLMRQTRATVRADPESAVEELRDMGYGVQPPAD